MNLQNLKNYFYSIFTHIKQMTNKLNYFNYAQLSLNFINIHQ